MRSDYDLLIRAMICLAKYYNENLMLDSAKHMVHFDTAMVQPYVLLSLVPPTATPERVID